MTIKKAIFFMLLITVLTGCEALVGEDDFFKQIDMFEQEIEQSNWETIAEQADELKNIYEENKWKIQLIGDEDEYETLHEHIHRLFAAIKSKDLTQTRLELMTIRSLLEQIYTL